MNTMLGEKLLYLADEDIAKAIITGKYKMPPDLDTATRLILEDVDRMGDTMLTGGQSEIVISSEDFKHFWRRVSKFTSLSMSGIHYGHYASTREISIGHQLVTIRYA
jgi:hypothetical protein